MKLPEGSGGTPGGVWMFLGGLLMAASGFYLISRTVVLHSGWSGSFYGIPFGLTMLPLLVGVGFLFYNSRSLTGWILGILGLGIIIAEILMAIRMTLKPVTLYQGLVMFVLFFGGIGLMLRSFRSGGQAGQ